MDTIDPDDITTSRDVFKSNDDVLLFVCSFVAGVATILLVRLLFDLNAIIASGLLVAIEFAYFLIVYLSPKFELRADRAADNIYFLGFMFTVTALGVSLYKFANADVTASNLVAGVIGDLAVGLISTIFGLLFRVILLQLRTDPHEHEDYVRLELAEAAEKVSAAIQEVNLLMEETVLHLKASTEANLTESEEMLKQGRSRINRLSTSADKLIEKLEEKISATDVSDTLLTDLFRPAVENLTEDSKVTYAGVMQLQRDAIEAQNAQIDSQLSKISANFSTIFQLKTEAVRNDVKATVGDVAAKLLKELTSSIKTSKVDLTQIASSIDEVISESMLQFSLELDKTREQMESLGKKVTEISSTFSETVGEGLRDYQEVSNETDKILSRIRTDLQRISQSYSRTVEEAARSMTKADSQLQTAVIEVSRNSLDNFTRQLEAMVDRLDKMAPRRTTDAVIPAQNAE